MKAATVAHIRSQAPHKPQGYEAACFAAGKLSADGAVLEFDDAAHAALRAMYPSAAGASPPSLFTVAKNAAGAFSRIVVAAGTGAQVLCSEEEKAARLATCDVCQHHAAGRCNMCGCWTGGVMGKAAIKTESCPDGRW